MLQTIGVASVDDLFADIPTALREHADAGLGRALSELEVRRQQCGCAHADGLQHELSNQAHQSHGLRMNRGTAPAITTTANATLKTIPKRTWK